MKHSRMFHLSGDGGGFNLIRVANRWGRQNRPRLIRFDLIHAIAQPGFEQS